VFESFTTDNHLGGRIIILLQPSILLLHLFITPHLTVSCQVFFLVIYPDRTLAVRRPPPQREQLHPVTSTFSPTSSHPVSVHNVPLPQSSTEQIQPTAQHDYVNQLISFLQVRVPFVLHSVCGLTSCRNIPPRFKGGFSLKYSNTSPGSQLRALKFECGAINSR
jgi:hypothetical protein